MMRGGPLEQPSNPTPRSSVICAVRAVVVPVPAGDAVTEPGIRRVSVGNGIHLSIAERNPGAPRTLILLHGYLDQKRSFDALCEALPPSWRTVCVDWRGHGDSDVVGAGGSYHLVDHVRDLDGLWRALDVKDGVLLGHSMGGNVALLFAGTVGGALKGLVLLESLGPPAEEQTDAAERLRSALLAWRAVKPAKIVAGLDEAVARLQVTNPGLSKEGALRMARHALRQTEQGWSWKFHAPLQAPPAYRFSEDGVAAFLRNIQVPVLLVRADGGYVPPRSTSPARYNALAQVRVVELSGMHHHVHVDAVTDVAAAITPFLATLD